MKITHDIMYHMTDISGIEAILKVSPEGLCTFKVASGPFTREEAEGLYQALAHALYENDIHCAMCRVESDACPGLEPKG